MGQFFDSPLSEGIRTMKRKQKQVEEAKLIYRIQNRGGEGRGKKTRQFSTGRVCSKRQLAGIQAMGKTGKRISVSTAMS